MLLDCCHYHAFDLYLSILHGFRQDRSQSLIVGGRGQPEEILNLLIKTFQENFNREIFYC